MKWTAVLVLTLVLAPVVYAGPHTITLTDDQEVGLRIAAERVQSTDLDGLLLAQVAKWLAEILAQADASIPIQFDPSTLKRETLEDLAAHLPPALAERFGKILGQGRQ